MVNGITHGGHVASHESNASSLEAAITIMLGLDYLNRDGFSSGIDEAEVADATLGEGHVGFSNI
jgi:hypothetical protein